MRRKERLLRYDYRKQVFKLLDSGRKLDKKEIRFIKEKFSGIGGLSPSKWSYGQFFTPPNVVSFVHNLLAIKNNPGKVLEPACGAGAFFHGLNQRLCTGIEASHNTFRVAKACYPKTELYNTPAERLLPCDTPSPLDEMFDYCIGNPPFGISIPWAGEIVNGRHKKVRSEIVFIEIAVRAVSPKGKIALVVPDSLLSNQNTQEARKWLMSKCFVRAVISLPDETFYHSGTRIKTSVLYLQKYPADITADDIENYPVFTAICKDVGWDRRGRKTHKEDLGKILDAWEGFNVEWAPELKEKRGNSIP